MVVAVMCPQGLGLVLEAPRGQRAVTLVLALALITKSLTLAVALVPSPCFFCKSLALNALALALNTKSLKTSLGSW